ncbi:hypothetical protein HYG86_05990 [Alkalicella caledoniensis]|uniref:Uncharacterized protein n=1 Tax=Alkalicella caledoniensis TaxID=2731377 RepID=A0A7G9W6P3_ALKCA|nr:hypothetical protein [Alkalicella caledoniensis]QNO14355.1 hypothetical protein HYG86_05990 [Alkalicella caledoniensis]
MFTSDDGGQNLFVSSDNVVGRLYNIIEKIINSTGNAETALSQVFELDEDDTASIFSNYAELYRMALEGKKQVDKHSPKSLKKYLNTLDSVIDGLSKIYFNASRNSLNNGLDKFKTHFDVRLMTSLEYCAEYLSNMSDEVIIQDEKVKELISDIENMIENISVSNINKELQQIVVFQLNNVRESLLKYKLFGAEGIKNGISATLGTLILNRDKVNSEKEKGVVEEIFKTINKINSIVSLGSNGTKLLGAIIEQITK